MKQLSFIFLATILYTTTFAQSAQVKKLDSLFNLLDSTHLAMGSIAIAKNGKIIYQRQIGYTYMDGDKKAAANPLSKYCIGSITKMFTAVIIFQLIEEKKLSLDTKLSQFYAGIPNADHITIKMLLRHRSGLIDYVNDSVSADRQWLKKPQPDSLILQKIKSGRPHFPPDSTTRYCNSGYWLLAKIAEKVEGEPFDTLIAKKIVSGAHIENIATDVVPDPRKDEAFSYDWIQGHFKYQKDFALGNVTGAGNLLATPTALIKFMTALFSDRLIHKSSLDSMMSFHGEPGFPNPFGMGLIRVPYYRKTGYGHTGATYGTFSNVFAFTADSLIVAESYNALGVQANDILVSVLNICYNEPEDFSEYKVTHFTVTARELDDFIGEYSNNAISQKFRITRKDEQLYAQFGNQLSYPYEATEKNTFEYKPAKVVLKFDRKKQSLTLYQNGQTIVFTKDP